MSYQFNPTERFSDRVVNYVKYRPSYPRQLVSEIEKMTGLNDETKVADIGFGTGLFTELLLERGWTVYGIEPNEPMRLAGEDYLQRFNNFVSFAGSAEQTPLIEQSVDLITAAQAFHWFEPEKAKAEFLRILRPGGFVAILWNDRESKSPFGAAYENFLRRHTTDYLKVRSANAHIEQSMAEFFAPNSYKKIAMANAQDLDWEGLWGRYSSSSYALKESDTRYEEARKALKMIFDHFQAKGLIHMKYQTEVFIGPLSK